jgi:hypothetical protein
VSESPGMNNRQLVFCALLIGVFCAGLVWWLEQFNRDRLIADFRAELDRLPTFKREGEVSDG